MKYETESGKERALAFKRSNPDLFEYLPVRLEVMERQGRLFVVMELNEDTTTSDLKKAITIALTWRNRLMEYQGVSHDLESTILTLLHDLHRAGCSYRQLAEMVNMAIGNSFGNALQQISRDRSAKVVLEQELAGLTDLADARGAGDLAEYLAIRSAYLLLYVLRYQEDRATNSCREKRKRVEKDRLEDIARVFDYMVEQFSKGEALCKKDYPFDDYRIETTLRRFRGARKRRPTETKERSGPRARRHQSGIN